MNQAPRSLSSRIGKSSLALLCAAAAAAILLGSTCNIANKAPSVPVISGPSSGVVGVPVTFKATATDPEGDSIAFQFDWGDTTTPAWSTFIGSGETLSVAHTYADSDTYSVMAKARDAGGRISSLSSSIACALSPAGPGHFDTILGAIDVQSFARMVTATPDGRMAYVAHYGQGILTPIRLQDRAVLSPLQIDGDAVDVVSSPDGSYVYASSGSDGYITAVRTSDNIVERRVALGGSTCGVDVSPDGGILYVAAPDAMCLYLLSAPDLVVLDSISTGQQCSYVAAGPSGEYVYASVEPGTVGVISTAQRRLVSSVPVGQFAARLDVSPDGQRLYVATRYDSGFAVVNTATSSVVSRVRISPEIEAVLAAPDSAYILATDISGLWLVNAISLTVVDMIPYPVGYGKPAIHPNGDTAYVPAGSKVYVLGKGLH
jgi:DNA-binding beta-propeller fold protein YncE